MQIDGLTADEVSAIESQGAYLAKVDAASAATENAAAADAFAHASLDYALAKARHDELVEQNPNASQDDFPAPVAPVPPVPRVAMTAHECAMSLVRSALDNIIEEHFSRNPRIVQGLFQWGYIEELGLGIDRMMEVMQQAMSSANSAFEQMTKASTSAFTSMTEAAKGKKK